MAFLILVSAFFLPGCLWPFGAASQSGVEEAASLPVSVQILNAGLLSGGGEIAFIPFVAGAGAEAGPEVDRLALMIVKGAADAVNRAPSGLRVSTGDDLSGTKFVLDGHIEAFDTDVKWKWVGPGRGDITLKVKGELRDRATGEVVALIFGQKIFRKIKNADEAAYEIGQGIGEGLVN